MTAKKCLRCLVSGRVQGVWYRASTRQQAVALGLVGFARNLADGRVEVLVCGDGQAVDRLVGWLASGPTGAMVTDVSTEAVGQDALDTQRGFEIR